MNTDLGNNSFINDVSQPLVSIICLTFNHESYIEQALDGLVMQKTNFPFEIIVHDDASDDATVAIVRQYEANHPGLFFCIFQKTNQYKIRANSILENPLNKARGKYVALCEGDDYWTDPLKLQKQVNLLEVNPECSMCVAMTECFGMKDNKEIRPYVNGENITQKYLYFKDFFEHYIHTSTYLIRSSFLNKSKVWFDKMEVNDSILLFILSDMGPVVFLSEKVSIHRMTSKGICSSLDPRKKALHVIKNYEQLYCKYRTIYRYLFSEKLLSLYISLLLSDIKSLELGNSPSTLIKLIKLICKHNLAMKAVFLLINQITAYLSKTGFGH